MGNLISVECFKCGVLFSVSYYLNSNWKRDKATFYCPNGHSQSYTKSTAEILQEELDHANEENLELKVENSRLLRKMKKPQRKKVKKIKKKK